MKDRQLKLLLIEDNPFDQELFKEILSTTFFSISNVTIVDKLQDGLQEIKRGNIDIVLLDLTLPDSDNLNGVKKVKATAPKLPVIILTGLNDFSFGRECIKEGAQDFLVKGEYDPFVLEKSILYACERQNSLIEQQRIEQQLREKQRIIEEQNKSLEATVAARTADLQATNSQLLAVLHETEEKSKKLKKALEDLKKAQAQLVQIEKMSSLGRLTAGIAHEINNPLNFIQTGAVCLQEKVDELFVLLQEYDAAVETVSQPVKARIDQVKADHHYPELKESVSLLFSDVLLGAHRTHEIIKGLQHFTRTNEHDIDEADVTTCLESTLLFLKYKLKDRITIVKDYQSNLPMIPCIPGLLNQVFMNILSNAIQAIDGKGTIWISVTASNAYLTVEIKDNGIGIPNVIKEKIFDPFFTTKEVGQGTGLGLAICYGIVKLHHGVIKVQSQPGQGTSVKTKLPLKKKTGVKGRLKMNEAYENS